MLQLRFAFASARGWPAASAALLWALAAGSVVFWWLHSPRQDLGASSSVHEAPAASGAQSSAAVVRALGHSAANVAAPDAQRRFQLLGVIASEKGQGSALIAVDGLPAKAYLVGQEVADGWRTASLSRYGVTLRSPEAGALQLEIADRKSSR